MRRNRLRRNSRNQAFTLIELLLVIVIIATLAAIVVPQLAGSGEKGRVGAAKGQITAFETALDLYEVDCGAYPTTAQGFEALRTAPSPAPKGWKGPYMKKEIPLDPWGNPYQYRSPGTHHPQGVDIWSNGLDGQEGTADDVQNWNMAGDKKN
jgi:general secretion pathway protein G